MSKKLIINCDEATSICDKNQYKEASLWDKMRLGLHIFLCKHCGAYSKQNYLVTKMMGKYINTSDGSKHLSEEEKKELEKKVNEKLN
jgi:hypothetical protein